MQECPSQNLIYTDSKNEKNKILFLSFLVMLVPFRHKIFIITYFQYPCRPFYLSLNIFKYFHLLKFSKLHFVGDNCYKIYGLLFLPILLLGAHINRTPHTKNTSQESDSLHGKIKIKILENLLSSSRLSLTEGKFQVIDAELTAGNRKETSASSSSLSVSIVSTHFRYLISKRKA